MASLHEGVLQLQTLTAASPQRRHFATTDTRDFTAVLVRIICAPLSGLHLPLGLPHPCRPSPVSRRPLPAAPTSTMRYGHMVRKYEAVSPYENAHPTRRLALSKHATTVILDLRNFFRSILGPRLVLTLVASPFILALFILFLRGTAPGKKTPLVAAIPGWEKYGYDEIRAGRSKKNIFRAAIRFKSYLKLFQQRRQFKVNPRKSISLIAACKNRKKNLALALPAWEMVKEIDEIVLVDWGSTSDQWGDLPILNSLIRTGRLSFIRVPEAGDWVLSRAYNLAAKMVTSKYILRVDCDTQIDPHFISRHPRPGPKQFYIVASGTERDQNELKLRGVWFTTKDNFFKVGGYDERITDYGYEDSDLYDRFQTVAKLQPKSINLDMVKHSVVGHLLWEKEKANKISKRMNEAIVKNAVPWLSLYKANRGMDYSYSYSDKYLHVYADITQTPPDPLQGKSEDERDALKVDVLQRALHDDYDIPWDILPSFSLHDLEYLAAYLDEGTGKRIIVVCLDGWDAVSNLFNLVSAVQLGLSSGRPVVVIWRGPDGSRIDQKNGAMVRQLFDLPATNELISQAASSRVGTKYGLVGKTRLIAAKEWPCIESFEACADKYDKAFGSLAEVVTMRRHVYDEVEPVPLSVLKHGFIRLTNMTKIGNEETRALAYKSLVQSSIVRDEQQAFSAEADVGVIAEVDARVKQLAANARAKHKEIFASEGGKGIPIVGSSQHAVRRELLRGNRGSEGYCEGESCSVKEMAKELANVLTICNAKELFPPVKAANREEWLTRGDVTSMMVADMRILHRNY